MKIKNAIRILALILTLALMLPLAACSADKSAAVMTFGDQKVTENMYKYWASSYKGSFLGTYEDISDKPEIWDSVLYDDVTYAEYFDDLICEYVKMTIVCMQLFEDYSLTISDSEKQSIDDLISDYIDVYAEGDKKMLDLALSEYGVSSATLGKIFLDEQKQTQVYDYLYGENGTVGITDTDRDEFYRSQYSRVKLIWVNNAYEYEYDDAGDYARDEDGNLVRTAISGNLLDEKNAKIAEISAALEEGTDFELLIDAYTELRDDETDVPNYPNGLYLSKTSDFNVSEVVSCAFNMEVGETTQISSEDYGTFFIEKLPLDDGAWANTDNADFFDKFDDNVKQEEFVAAVTAHFDKITVDEDTIAKYSVRDVTANYSFN